MSNDTRSSSTMISAEIDDQTVLPSGVSRVEKTPLTWKVPLHTIYPANVGGFVSLSRMSRVMGVISDSIKESCSSISIAADTTRFTLDVLDWSVWTDENEGFSRVYALLSRHGSRNRPLTAFDMRCSND